MIMKNTYLYSSIILLTALLITSCSEDFLDKEPQSSIVIENFYKTGKDAILATTAVYTPLEWEFNKTYYCEWMLGDVVSDDALKGGNGINDMSQLFQLENFTTSASNEIILEYYRTQYQGIFRSNLAINNIPNIEPDDDMNLSLKKRLIAEAKTLRAFYYFRLVRAFGGVPKVTKMLKSSDEYMIPRAPRDTIYKLIYDDLLTAIPDLWLKDQYETEDLGRITKGTAEALLMKTYLYDKKWDEAKAWGDSIISSGKYHLNNTYLDNFLLSGENSPESVFEVQYMEDATSDYGDGNGYTRGSFTVILQRTRTGNLGWGFNRPSTNLVNEYETGDPRKDATIFTDTQDSYLGNTYHSRKYALEGYVLAHATRAPLNYKLIRYSDVLLMYAEAACEANDLVAAKNALEQVRFRAREGNTTILPEFPYGTYSDDQDGLRKAIRHERRVELAMEGHRFFDLVRWGVAAQVMNDYISNESATVKNYMLPFVAGKHELFPIPEIERNIDPLLDQNPNY